MRHALLTLSLFVASSAGGAPGVEGIFSPGFILQDRNGDGVVDHVHGEIVLGGPRTAGLAAAASDVAARLGFETMAMDLPLPSGTDAVRIRIGGASPAIPPGEGLVKIETADSRETVVVSGVDEDGTRAAAAYLAGRLPHLWDPDGPTLSTALADLRGLLGFEPPAAAVEEIRVRKNGVSLLKLSVELASAEDLERARTALGAGLAYENVDRIAVRLSSGGRSLEVPLAMRSVEGRPRPSPPRPGSAPKYDLDLSNLYTPDGLLGDSDQNLIADRIDCVLSPAGAYRGAADLAARLGLEAAGVSIPISKLEAEIENAEEEPTLVLIGDHRRAAERKRELAPGEGSIEVVPAAFGEKPALVISGGDEAGVERALGQVAVRFPHVWDRGKDRTTIDDVEMDLWKFFSGRSPDGQAAIGLYKLDRLVAELSGKSLRSARVLVSLEKPDAGLGALVEERARALGASSLEVEIDDRDVQNARTVFEEGFSVPWEVDELRRLFRERVLPRVKGRRAVEIEARLSEPRPIREGLRDEIVRELTRKGVRAPRVRILSAYKQGYSWIEETIATELEGKKLEGIEIRFAEYRPPAEWPHQAMGTKLRWLHEIFPVDEVLARELGLPLDRIRFEMAPPDSPPYEIIATSTEGVEILRERFAPKMVLRPYLDRFRDYEMVNVTTGWVTAVEGGEVLLDQRIATDAELFWDHFQSDTLERIYDYVMAGHEGEPRGGGKDAPLFGELEVELSLSEPHERLGVDQEILSPMDALHEDVYFTTLMFFRLLGRNARGEELTYPGRVLPVMTPSSDGKPGEARIRFTGFATSRPAVVIDYETVDGTKDDARLDIPRIEMDRPRAMAARVREGARGLESLEVAIKVDTEKDERGELLRRERAEDVDGRILSAEQVTATLEILNELRGRGLYRHALAYHDLKEISIAASWEFRRPEEHRKTATLRAGGAPEPWPDVTRYLEHVSRSPSGELVQWDTPIPPPEAYGILAEMSRFPEATVYRAGKSYLGKEVWAMDLMPRIEASHVSRYKATTFKPTVVYSARQHANEVSSTSHVLKLAEMLLEDPEEKKKLDRVNVVVHPITNPDGAQLAYDLYRRTPDFILHAGYLASLGMDVTSDAEAPLPIYPEASVRPRLWNAWLPDVFLNPHGYPSHQLVQLFSEYTGLVRRGRVTERNWSMNKGWFIPGFEYLDDPRYPRHKEAAFQIRDYITKAINRDPAVYAMNQRNYDRYDRYGGRFGEEAFKLPMVDEVMIHTAIKGDRAPGPGARDAFNPKVTIWSGTTEAPDETASGDWLKLVAKAGLSWDLAILQYLLDGEHEVERKGSTFFGGVSFRLDRPRPPEESSPRP
jgi:hypothetical protein